MSRTRILFLLIGSVFLGIGMITAGLFKIAQDQVISGVVLIVKDNYHNCPVRPSSTK